MTPRTEVALDLSFACRLKAALNLCLASHGWIRKVICDALGGKEGWGAPWALRKLFSQLTVPKSLSIPIPGALFPAKGYRDRGNLGIWSVMQVQGAIQFSYNP